jgi:zinc transport system substrate-binding protein
VILIPFAVRRAAAGLAALACLAGCGTGSATKARATGPSGPTIVTGFYPLYEVASRVGGGEFKVVNLTPAGAEPHDLELTPAELERVMDARLVLYLGDGFQPALEEAARQRGGSSIDILSGMTLRPPPEGGHDGAEELAFDPHVWLDPDLMKDVVTRTRKVLEGIDGRHAATFADNARAYLAELDELDAAFRAGLAHCRSRAIVTSHAAFGYLAQRYGLEQQAISGLSPDSEPAPERLEELANLVRTTGVSTVFTETLASPRTAEALAREARVQTAVLNPIEGLTPAELAAGKSYASIMRENLAALRSALGCG